MQGILQSVVTKFQKPTLAEQEYIEFRDKLVEDIHEVCERLQALQSTYKMTYDEDLIDSIIYEELSLKSKYSYLIKLARKNNLTLDKLCIFSPASNYDDYE